MRSNYYIVKNLDEVKTLIESCRNTGYCCYDFETNAQPIYNNSFKPTLLSICFQPGFAVAIPLDHFETSQYTDKGYNWKKALDLIGKNLMRDRSIVKMGWNVKFDNQIWLRYGFDPQGTILDGMLAKYVLDEEKPNGLKEMVARYLPEFAGYQTDNNLDKLDWDKKPLEPLSKYGCLDVDLTFRLMMFFEAKLIKLGLYQVYRNLYMPASRVLTEVEANGLYMDREFNKELLESYKPKIDAARDTIMNLPRVKKFQKAYNDIKVEKYIESLQREISELDPDIDQRKIASRETKIANIRAGIFTTKKEQDLIRPINLGSPVDLPAIMFGEGGFGFEVLKTSDTGKPSTDEDTLVELRLKVKKPDSPKAIFLDKLLELRGLEKMYKTYIEGWNEKVQDDSRLHGRFLIHGTTSGRLSSAEPNLQQIPKTSVDANIKNQLKAPKGQLYFVMDFSQAELRMMAHLSKDETYLKAFAEGQDPHLAIAAQKYGVSYQEAKISLDNEDHADHKAWKTRRKQAKQIAFGLIYGIGSKLLAVKLSDPKAGLIVSPEEAQEMMDDFFSQHPKIKKFKAKQEKFLQKNGYIPCLFGTKRRLPQIYSKDNNDVAYAIRLGLNFPCQSAASHMTLFGSILNYWDMKQGNFPPMTEVASVHDSVYYNVDPKYINVYTIWQMWETFRNPKTQKYFGFSIDDVDMSMSFGVGRSMAEELPFIPGYDYSNMLKKDFDVDEYMKQAKAYLDIEVKDYPRLYPKEFEEGKKWKA